MVVKGLASFVFLTKKGPTTNGQLSSLLSQQSADDQKLESSPTCWHCKTGEAETIGHVLLACPKYEEIRRELLNQLRQNLESLGERGNHAWSCFARGSLSYQMQVILGVLQFGGLVDEAIAQFSSEYAAKAWNGRIVI